MAQDLNIGDLALERTKKPALVRLGGAKLLTRYVLPIGILAGFLALVMFAGGFAFVPPRAVTVVPVITTRAEAQNEGMPLFQAAGWIEPRPSLVNIAALAEGVIEQILVVEGQEVAQGEPVARLIDTDAKLALRQAETTKELREAELAGVKAELKAAKVRYENPVHLRTQLSQAEAALAKSKLELSRLPFQITTARAQLDYADENLRGKQSAGDAIPGRLISQAKSERDSAHALVAELEQRAPQLEAEMHALERQVSAANEQLRLLVDESRQSEDAEARYAAASANVKDAEIAVEQARLRLTRSTITAPITGKILKLLSHPGTRVMGLESAAGQSSSSIATMYDPKNLQARADVRLEDVPLVTSGQQVVIETASASKPIVGRVLLATSAANVQKNTLEVKVAIDDPPATIGPEMLVTVTFLAPPSTKTMFVESSRHRLLIPRQLIQSVDAASVVWVVDSENRARKRVIKLGKSEGDSLIEVTEGITATDKLISTGGDAVSDGELVEVRGDDPAIGIKAKNN